MARSLRRRAVPIGHQLLKPKRGLGVPMRGLFVAFVLLLPGAAVAQGPDTGFLVTAQSVPAMTASEIPDLVGVWDGTGRARPGNGPNMPWTPDNFPVLNERALAYQKVFDEALAPKYDCLPSSSPALQYDPYM